MPNAESKQTRGTQILGLDLLRFFAAMWVLLHHLTFSSWADPNVRGTPAAKIFEVFMPIAQISAIGWVGVEIFFVISGYVIALSANGKSPFDFLRGRFLRLVPAVWICATASVPMLMLNHVSPETILRSYINSIIFWPIKPWMSAAYWTLSIEIIFYALIFFLLCVDQFRKIEGVAILLGVLSTAGWILYWTQPLFDLGHFVWLARFTGDERIASFLLLRHGCFFALGVTLWLISSKGAAWYRLLTMGGVSIGCILQVATEAAKASEWTGYNQNPALTAALWCVAAFFVAASITCNRYVSAAIGRYSSCIRAVGLSTYPIYLVHEPLGKPIVLYLLRQGWSPYFAFSTATVVIVSAGILVALWLEPRLRAAMGTKFTALSKRFSPHGRMLRRTTELQCHNQLAIASEIPAQ